MNLTPSHPIRLIDLQLLVAAAWQPRRCR